MLKPFYMLAIRFPKTTLLLVALVTLVAFSRIQYLDWETDARVYFPKGHPAIKFDEEVADTFGVKDSIIIAIVNDNGIFNPKTLARVARISDKLAALPGVEVIRRVDVASLSTATVFHGTADELANIPLMETLPTNEEQLTRIRDLVYSNPDLFVGNLVSADGKATMIRVKLKEGIEHRYQAYFQVRGILSGELQKASQDGADTSSAWPSAGGGQWGDNGTQDWKSGQWQDTGEWGGAGGWDQPLSERTTENGDRFFMAGRPVIEVTSGQNALSDLKVMIPLLCFTILVVLFIIFRNGRGVVLPILVVTVAIVWTMGAMSALGVPMYTISTMLPVILVAVGIGDALHILSHYEDIVLEDTHRPAADIVGQLMHNLGTPLLITTLTTAVGFLSLWWAEMPPFRLFGVFTAIGIVFCWLASVTLVPAALAMMQPHVSGYLRRRRSMRVHDEAGMLTRTLVAMSNLLTAKRGIFTVAIALLVIVLGFGGGRLFVDSSWIGDFKKDSEVVRANNVLNQKFDGTIFLNVVVDGGEPDAMKSPILLAKIDALQNYVEKRPEVGGSISLVDYLRSTNKTFHADNEAYDVLPSSRQEISEFLFLLSVSGRPEQLDSVVDYGYQKANVTIAIKTDHTEALKEIIDDVRQFVGREFAGLGVDVNLAGSANNSYVWADLLIDSQVSAILLSKIGILLVAMLLFRSVAAGFLTVLPVTVTTIVVAGAAGWLRIPMDVSTVLAAGVAIGVGVDYTVHYVFRYANEKRLGQPHGPAVLAAMRGVGKPIVFNAAVVTAGFLVLGLSEFPPHIKLGYFVSSYMVVACLAALVLLPLALAWIRPKLGQSSQA